MLIGRFPYFRNMLYDNRDTSNMIAYPDLDRFAFGLLVRQLYGTLFTGTERLSYYAAHICLYVPVQRFQIEKPKNNVLDLARLYYQSANMTAPAYGLE